MLRISKPQKQYVNILSMKYMMICLSAIFVLASQPSIAVDLPGLIISEFMANNSDSFTDGNDENSDWIEIYNPTSEAVKINSWYLTDDLTDLRKWNFPSADIIDLTIQPGAYLVLIASGKGDEDNYIDDLAYIHTNFKLDSSGEDIALVMYDGATIVHQYEDYPEQKKDISYGTDSALTQEGYFDIATPGEGNGTIYEGAIEKIEFSVERGFYDEPFDLEITSDTPDVTIRYTLDGSEPAEDYGEIYSGLISISSTTVLRAAAFKEGYIPAKVKTNTYIFVQDVINQSPTGEAPGEQWPDPSGQSGQSNRPGRPDFPGGGSSSQAIDYGMDLDVTGDPVYAEQMEEALLSISTLSIVTDLDNLFDSTSGIYANALQDGREWERKISLELIHPDQREGFQVNAGLRIRGGMSRNANNPKHSFRLFFRSEYGDAKLNYPLFEDEGVSEFDKIDLRTGQNFSWHLSAGSNTENSTWLYDIHTRDSQARMGHPYTRSRYYHLYINGQYWGLYQTEERPESSFSASYMGGDEEDYDVLKSDNDTDGTIYAADGQLDDYYELWTEVNNGLSDKEDYFRLQGLASDGLTEVEENKKLLDVNNLIDYMLLIFYTGNRDSPIGPPDSDRQPRNMYAIFNRNEPDGVKFITHDNEHTLGVHLTQGVNYNRLSTTLISSLKTQKYCNPWYLNNKLLEDSAEYRLRFADRVYKHFFNSGVLTPEISSEIFISRKAEIDMAVIAESARWGDYLSPNAPMTKNDHWLPIVNRIIDDYIQASPKTRTDVVFSQIKSKGWYPDIDPPVLNQHGGEVEPGFQLTFTGDIEDIYYTLDGEDPRLPGGAISSAAIKYEGLPVVLNQSAQVMVRSASGDIWSALSEAAFNIPSSLENSLRITELYYNPSASSDAEILAGYDNDEFEFIEIMNISQNDVLDLSTVSFTNGIQFDFADASKIILQPGEVVLVVRNQAAFQLRYGSELNVIGQYEGRLDNGGEKIKLESIGDVVIQEFEYDDNAPWPESADGEGYSLAIVSTSGDYNDPENWQVCEQAGGSPGEYVEEGDSTYIREWMNF